MSVYAKQGGHIVLMLSRAEANALFEVASAAEDLAEEVNENGGVAPDFAKNHETVEARNRALRALETAIMPGSRSGAAF